MILVMKVITMEKLNEKVKAFIAINYKKWDDYEHTSHPIENIHQFEKWWYDDFLFTLPEPNEDGENYFCINEVYTPETFFENDLTLFSLCIKAVHDYYIESENLYPEDEPYARSYDPREIMTQYASVYVLNNTELMNLYLPSHLRANINSPHPSPV